MKRNYVAPVITVEGVLVADSSVASYTKDDCVVFDDVTDTYDPITNTTEGYVYINSDGKLAFCEGWGS